MKKIFIYFICVVLTNFACASERLLPPDPNQLHNGWWSYFEESKQDVPDRILVFEESLKKLVEQMNGPARDKAERNLEWIHHHFQSYLNAIALNAPVNTPLSPIADSYSLDHTLEIYRAIKKNELDVKAYDDERQEKQKQMCTAQDNLDRLSISYAKAPDRSEEKIILALELISHQAAYESAKRSYAHLNALIEQDNKQLTALKEELTNATSRIAVNHLDLKKISHAVADSERYWNNEKQKLEEKQASSPPHNQPDETDISEAAHQKYNQNLIHFQIREATARNQMIFSKIMFALARVIQEPKTADPGALRTLTADWLHEVKEQKAQVDEWNEAIRKLFLRYTQIVTMGNMGTKNSEEIAMLQKDVLQQARTNFMMLQRLGNTLDDSNFLLDEVDHRVTHLMGSKERYLMDVMDFSYKSWYQAVEWLNKPIVHISDKPITTFSLIEFFGIMLLVVWLSRFVANALTRFSLTRQGIQKSLVYKITRLVKYLILTFGLIIALSAVGFDFSSLLLIAGALGVGLGFGLQSIFNNFVSGLIILFESHLKVGDIIEVSGIKGEVREINVRSTIVTTGEGSEIIIPNSELITAKVVNWTMNDSFRKLHVPFKVANGTDKDFVAKVVEEAASKVKSSVPQSGVTAPRVSFVKFGNDGLDFELTIWFDQRYSSTRGVMSDYLWAVDNALNENKIERPTAELDVRVKKTDP